MNTGKTIATIKTMRGVSVSDVKALCVCDCVVLSQDYISYCMPIVCRGPTSANVVTHISYIGLEPVGCLSFYQYSTISKYTHFQNQKGQSGI